VGVLIIFVYNRHVVKRFSVLSYNTPVESLDCAAADLGRSGSKQHGS